MKGLCSTLNEDTLGAHLKSCVAQYVALELSRERMEGGGGGGGTGFVQSGLATLGALAAGGGKQLLNRLMPWLYHPPAVREQGPREFIDSVAHIRLLSWLLIGSLTQLALSDVISLARTVNANASSTAALCPQPTSRKRVHTAGVRIRVHSEIITRTDFSLLTCSLFTNRS